MVDTPRAKKPRKPRKPKAPPPLPVPLTAPPPNGHAEAAPPPGPLAHSLSWQSADRVIRSPIDWLLPGLVPRGRVTSVIGEAGVGKSTLYASLIAAVTRGCAHSMFGPAAAAYAPGCAVIYTSEGCDSEEMIGRLKAAGADLSRVALGDTGPAGGRAARLQIPTRLGAAGTQWMSHRISLVVIDPIISYLSDGVSPMDSVTVRQALECLDEQAALAGVTVVYTCHLRKSREGSPLDWIAGASAWSQVPRHIVALGRDPEHPAQRVVLAAKYSATREPVSLTYEIVDSGGFGVIRLGGPSRVRAEDLGRGAELVEERDALDDARSYLRDALEEEERRACDMVRRARECGISERTLRRAKVVLGVTSHHEGRAPDRHLMWRRPESWPE